MRINNVKNNQNFKSLSPFSNALGQFYNANATIPTLIIETGVTLGRAYEANKRGGKPEAVDRLVEQGISAIVWIYGVKALQKIGDFIGEKILKYDLNFDIGFDKLRNPLENVEKNALRFKAGNILACTAIATYFIGAILPKINNAILDKTLKKQKEKNVENTKDRTSFSDFKNQTKNDKNISFTSLSDVIGGAVVNSAHILENNSTARLFITDTGVIAGRFANAPNKYRKIEGLFRDIASIYFYLKATEHISGGLNKLFNDGAQADPKVIEKTVEKLTEKLKENPDLSIEDFKRLAISKAKEEDLAELKKLFNGEKFIDLNTFIDTFKPFKGKAIKMSAMQHKKFLSYQQAMDILVDSWVSTPEFLEDTFNSATNKTIRDPKTFVSSKKLDEIRASVDKFIEQIIKRAKKDNSIIDEAFIKKIAKQNIGKNFLFNVIGTAVSIFALGFLIPKIQYAITKKLTNEDKFHTEKE